MWISVIQAIVLQVSLVFLSRSRRSPLYSVCFIIIFSFCLQSSSVAQSCLTHLKRPWCWKKLRAGEEEDDRGWDSWMVSPTWWTWVWGSSRSWWWTGNLACCSPWGRKESDMTEWLNWLEKKKWFYHKVKIIWLEWKLTSNYFRYNC